MVRTVSGKNPKYSDNATKTNSLPRSNQGNCTTTVSSVSSVARPTTNGASNIPNATQVVGSSASSLVTHVNSQRRPMVEGIYSYNSRKKPRYRPNQAKKKNERFKEKLRLESGFRTAMIVKMSAYPHLYRIYNVTEFHCRKYIGSTNASGSMYCGLLQCTVKHEEADRKKITQTNKGDFYVLLNDITINGVNIVYNWNHVKKKNNKQLTENNIPLVRRYDEKNHIYEKNVIGAWSDVWSLTSSKNSNDWNTINRQDGNVIEEVSTGNEKVKEQFVKPTTEIINIPCDTRGMESIFDQDTIMVMMTTLS